MAPRKNERNTVTAKRGNATKQQSDPCWLADKVRVSVETSAGADPAGCLHAPSMAALQAAHADKDEEMSPTTSHSDILISGPRPESTTGLLRRS